jgi:hypothetical protein
MKAHRTDRDKDHDEDEGDFEIVGHPVGFPRA